MNDASRRRGWRSLPSRLVGIQAHAWWLRRTGRGALLQPSAVTSENRHPELFDFVQTALGDIERPSLLSFGCSTGEEVFTLARRFPTADVRGIDINRACIRAARRRLAIEPNPRISFVRESSARDEHRHKHDAVFALSVLRQGRLDAEAPDDCSHILSFDRFAAAVAALDTCLKPGGYLVIWGSHFRFTDTPTAAAYAVELTRERAGHCPIYDADNRRIADAVREDIVFRKAGVRSLCG